MEEPESAAPGGPAGDLLGGETLRPLSAGRDPLQNKNVELFPISLLAVSFVLVHLFRKIQCCPLVSFVSALLAGTVSNVNLEVCV